MSNLAKPSQVVAAGRLSYASIWEPRPAEKPGDKAMYQCMLIIRKDDTKTVQALNGVIKPLIETAKAANNGVLPSTFKYGLRDGDTDRPADPNLKGCLFLNCSSKYPPAIVDRNPQHRITEQHRVYSGCNVRLDLNVYLRTNAANPGIGFGLNSVQFVSDGEPLGGGRSAEAAFGEALEDQSDSPSWMD